MKALTSWASIRKSESDLILRETTEFVGGNFESYGRKEIRKPVTLRDGSVEERFVRRSARNDGSLLLTAG